jgi:hypothetical protein
MFRVFNSPQLHPPWCRLRARPYRSAAFFFFERKSKAPVSGKRSDPVFGALPCSGAYRRVSSRQHIFPRKITSGLRHDHAGLNPAVIMVWLRYLLH